MYDMLKVRTPLPEYMSDHEMNLITRSAPDLWKAIKHRRHFLFDVYRDNDEYRTSLCEAWMTHTNTEAGKVLREQLRADNAPGSNKGAVAKKLSLMQIQHETGAADNVTFRAIWDPLKNGLTSMVSFFDRDIELLRLLSGDPEKTREEIVDQFEVPFLTPEQYKDKLAEKAKKGKGTVRLQNPPQMPVADSKYHIILDSWRKSRISPAVQIHHEYAYTNTITELKKLRTRVLNKHACYINLLFKDTVTACIQALYNPNTAAAKALPTLRNKAESVDFLVSLIKNEMVKDGSWNDPIRLRQALIRANICTVPQTMQGQNPDKSLLGPASVAMARKNLEKHYSTLFDYEVTCPAGHFVDFYSGQGASILKSGSQMVNFRLRIHDLPYTSLEEYYQLRKHATLGYLKSMDKYAKVKFLKADEKPTGNDVEIADHEWDLLWSGTIHSDLTHMFNEKTCTGKKARLVAKCMVVDTSDMDPDAAADFLQAQSNDVVQTLIDGNWVKFQTLTYKAALLMTGTAVLVESCPNTCDCKCGIGCDDDMYTNANKAKWCENLLGKTLMAIRHAFFEEERTGVLEKPTQEDVENCWDWRQPWNEFSCPMCDISEHRAPLGYAPFYGTNFYATEAKLWEAGLRCAKQYHAGVPLDEMKSHAFLHEPTPEGSDNEPEEEEPEGEEPEGEEPEGEEPEGEEREGQVEEEQEGRDEEQEGLDDDEDAEGSEDEEAVDGYLGGDQPPPSTPHGPPPPASDNDDVDKRQPDPNHPGDASSSELSDALSVDEDLEMPKVEDTEPVEKAVKAPAKARGKAAGKAKGKAPAKVPAKARGKAAGKATAKAVAKAASAQASEEPVEAPSSTRPRRTRQAPERLA
jgi:hypothetical protein